MLSLTASSSLGGGGLRCARSGKLMFLVVAVGCGMLFVLFERFTERARQVVVLAQDEARALRHGHIGTEHVLLGLRREEDGLAARVLASYDITVEQVRAEVVQTVGMGKDDERGQTPFTARAKKVLELSLDEARSLGHHDVGTEHILLGLVRQGEGVGFRVLRGLDADPEKLRADLRSLAASQQVPPETVRGTATGMGVTRASVSAGGSRSPGVRRLMVETLKLAAADGRSEVDIPDVLLALISDSDNASLLLDLGIDAPAVHENLMSRREAGTSPDQA